MLWAALSPDGRQAAAVGRELAVKLHDLAGAPPRALAGHEQAVYRAANRPDAAQLATVSSDMSLRVWDLGRGQPLFNLRLPAAWEEGQQSPLWDLARRCLPAGAAGPHAGNCWAAVPLTMGRLVLYRVPYAAPPASLDTAR